MAYDATKPADDEYLSAFPAEMREQLRAILQDAIVNALTVNGYSPGNLNGNIPLSNGNLNTNLNAELLGGHAAAYFSVDGHVHAAATQSTAGFMSNTDKTKLDGVATGAEVNQNAFSNVAVGTETIQADSKTDTLTLTAGANIAITPDATNDKVTIEVTGTVSTAADAARATADAAGNVIADTYFPKSGGTINGDIHANEYYATGWFKSLGDSGWLNATHQGGWYMTDDTWIRSFNGKNVYTIGQMKADGGFYGDLHGNADTATSAITAGTAGSATKATQDGNGANIASTYFPKSGGLITGEIQSASSAIIRNTTSNISINSLTFGAGIYDAKNSRDAFLYTQSTNTTAVGNDTGTNTLRGTTHGALDAASTLGGYTATQLVSKVAGGSAPTLTSILDGCYDGNGNKYTKVSNTGTGISGYTTGNIRLTQSYKNFDKILIVSAGDECNFEKYILWDTWQLAYAFSTCGWLFDLLNGACTGGYWNIWSTIQAGTSTHPLSTDTIWYLCEETSVMVDVIGVKY